MILRPPRSTRTDTLFPYTTLFRSLRAARDAVGTGDAHRRGIPDHDVLVVRVKCIEVAAAAGALADLADGQFAQAADLAPQQRVRRARSEERRVGTVGGRTCRSRWWRVHNNKHNQYNLQKPHG